MSKNDQYCNDTTYNIARWGEGYFHINTQGELVCDPFAGFNGQASVCHEHAIPLAELCKTLQKEHGLRWPLLIRFSDILTHRVQRLCKAFDTAMKGLDYSAGYTSVYPIKVNQQKQVVARIANEMANKEVSVGLEAGSKPELLAIMAMAKASGATLVCNGYKDREYIRLALIATKMGHSVFIVVEKLSELVCILDEAEKLKVTPQLGLRVKLASIGKGNWQNTGGEKSKFGLSASQVLTFVEALKRSEKLHYLKLLHFHLGSQIANIRDIQTGLKECTRFFEELRAHGAYIDYVDVGGGLGVDYEGTGSRTSCSMNYTVEEYANKVVQAFKVSCDQIKAPYPHIITESGRAMTAHHAVLITNVIDVESSKTSDPKLCDNPSQVIIDLWQAYKTLKKDGHRSILERYHDVAYYMEECQSRFLHGSLSLDERACAESIQQAVNQEVQRRLELGNRQHRPVLDEVNEKLADKLFVNFSLFQSLPDIWGIDQIFPILPLTGLNNPPSRQVVLQDITCDSDGRIDWYVESSGTETTLSLPVHDDKEPLLLGFFLVGAYQEILGDMHNLFGDTDTVDVTMDAQGGFVVDHITQGDNVEKVLQYVNFDTRELLQIFHGQLQMSCISESERQQFFAELQSGLASYTYLLP